MKQQQEPMKQQEDPISRLVRAKPNYFKNLVTKNRKYNVVLSKDRFVLE